MRRRRRMLAALVLTILCVAAGAYGYIYYNSFFERSQNAHVEARSTEVKTQVNGKITKVFVKETQVVKAGDPLMQLDPKEFQATFDERNRELEKSEQRLAGGKAQLARMEQKLAETGDEALRKQYNDARAWYARSQNKAQKLRESVTEARTALNATLVTAPMSGHIAQKRVDVGIKVAEGEPVADIVGEEKPWVVANFKEVQMDKIQAGQKAEIIVPKIHRAFTGRVERLPIRSDGGQAAPKTPLQKLIARYFTQNASLTPVRIAFDSSSLGSDSNRLANGAEAQVKVFVK